MSLAPALPFRAPADLEAQRYELARARQLARAWAGTLPEPRRRDMAALFTRVALDTYRLQACPHARLSPPFAQPYGQLDSAVAELAQAVGREAAPRSTMSESQANARRVSSGTAPSTCPPPRRSLGLRPATPNTAG